MYIVYKSEKKANRCRKKRFLGGYTSHPSFSNSEERKGNLEGWQIFFFLFTATGKIPKTLNVPIQFDVFKNVFDFSFILSHSALDFFSPFNWSR